MDKNKDKQTMFLLLVDRVSLIGQGLPRRPLRPCISSIKSIRKSIVECQLAVASVLHRCCVGVASDKSVSGIEVHQVTFFFMSHSEHSADIYRPFLTAMRSRRTFQEPINAAFKTDVRKIDNSYLKIPIAD